MPLRNTKQIGAGLDLLAGRAMRAARKAIKAETTDVLVDRVKRVPSSARAAGSPGGDAARAAGSQSGVAADAADYAALRDALGGDLLASMGTNALSESVASMTTQAALIGRTAATPAAPAGGGLEGRAGDQ